jgi:pimeloyl-ACP methyl ester carboxylesterase
MPYAEINAMCVYYEEQGEGEPLLLLHGALGAVDPAVSSGWFTLLPALAARYRAFAVETRGHGRTNNPAGKLSYKQLGEDVAAFIERLDLGPVHLAGFSDGATFGLLLGMTRPELLRSLVAVGANYCIDDHLREGMAFFDAESIERESPEFAAELARRHDVHHRPGYWRELLGQIRENVEREMTWTEDDLRRIPTPTLLVMGEADFALSLEQMLEMRRSIPHSEMLILNHADMDGLDNHRVQATRPEVVGPVMLEFLGRHAGTG